MQNKVFKALSHPDRRALLALLRDGPRPAGDLAAEFKASWPTMSRHLAVLKEAGLVSTDRDGTSVIYTVTSSVIEDAAASLLALIEHRAENRNEHMGEWEWSGKDLSEAP